MPTAVTRTLVKPASERAVKKEPATGVVVANESPPDSNGTTDNIEFQDMLNTLLKNVNSNKKPDEEVAVNAAKPTTPSSYFIPTKTVTTDIPGLGLQAKVKHYPAAPPTNCSPPPSPRLNASMPSRGKSVPVRFTKIVKRHHKRSAGAASPNRYGLQGVQAVHGLYRDPTTSLILTEYKSGLRVMEAARKFNYRAFVDAIDVQSDNTMPRQYASNIVPGA
jgi:hypothetical protein